MSKILFKSISNFREGCLITNLLQGLKSKTTLRRHQNTQEGSRGGVTMSRDKFLQDQTDKWVRHMSEKTRIEEDIHGRQGTSSTLTP